VKTYRIRLKTKGPFITEWQSDTLFGSLCWALRYSEGEKALKDFLDPFKEGNPTFILSNGFPGEFLPAPIHLDEIFSADEKGRRKVKEVRWLSPGEFRLALAGEKFELDEPARREPYKPLGILHARVSRTSGTTGEEGSLYELSGLVPRDGKISIYARVADGFEGLLSKLFDLLSRSGFGKKKSSGAGAFSVEGTIEPFDDFGYPEGANAWVNLSNYVPRSDDPTEGYYRVFVKYGKLGEEYALAGNPFKRPLIMIEPGAVFRSDNPRQWYGRLVEGVAPAYPEVVQSGFAFAVPARFPR